MAMPSRQPVLTWTRIDSLQCSPTMFRSFVPLGLIAKFTWCRSCRFIHPSVHELPPKIPFLHYLLWCASCRLDLQSSETPCMDGINLNNYYLHLHIIWLSRRQIIHWYHSEGFLQYDCQSGCIAYIVYHFYSCPVKYFQMVLIYTYLYHVGQIFGATQKLKNVCSEYFLILKPKYVEDLTLYLSDKKNG